MSEVLHVFLAGRLAGELEAKREQMAFRYSEIWQRARHAIPLSLSMPRVLREHSHRAISPFLWNLLPDNEQVITAWSRRYRVSSSTPFGLLSHVGEECAGAVQFVRSDRLEEVGRGDLQSLDEDEIAGRLAALRQDPSITRNQADLGQFSLSGAQAKTALRKTPTGWALPSGAEPTTHIFKPPRPDLAGHVENEHFCLQLGQAAGLVCVNSEIHRFGKELAIVVARYDRQLSQDQKHWLRLHQEDFCQVLACQPANKYESNGGPGIAQIMEVLRGSREPEIDRRRFMQAIAFNYVIGGTDAHAKNYSLLHAPTHFRLAPLYDIASILPYIDRRRDMRLAMRVGRHYDPEYILPRHWETLARQCGFPADDLLIILRDFIVQLPDLALTVYRTMQSDGLDHSVLKRLVDGIAKRCAHLAKRFQLAEP